MPSFSLPVVVVPLLVLAGCSGEVPDTEAPRAAVSADVEVRDPVWLETVQRRIRDGAHAFAAHDGGSFSARVPQQGLRARYDADGVHIRLDGQQVGLRTVAWGRPGQLAERSTSAPVLGACQAGRVDPAGDCLRRLEYRGALTEWWVSLPAGLEQGWDIARSPAGSGPLVLELGLEGAVAEAAHDGLRLRSESASLRVSGLSAHDADGTALPARLEPLAGGFRVSVDDRGARYPLSVDPVYSTADWEMFGNEYVAAVGYSLSSAGDVNGDGYDDILIGTPDFRDQTGGAWLFLGSSAGPASEPDASLAGEAVDAVFGWDLSPAGDVDGDGYDDVIIGAYGSTSAPAQAYVFYGSASGLSASDYTGLPTPGTGSSFGHAVAGLGDVNGDGYDDVAVGEYLYSSFSTGGAVHVYHGSASGVATTPTAVRRGEKLGNDYFGFDLAAAGDVDGDGYDDMVVGAPAYDGGFGRAYLFLGGASGLSPTAQAHLDPTLLVMEFGESVAGAGDVDGDGYDDVIVGSDGTGSSIGFAWVYLGSGSGLSGTSDITLSESCHFGDPVAGVGDVDGDGYGDLMVGCTPASGTCQVFLYQGSAAGLSTTTSLVLESDEPGDYFGHDIAAAGDVNGDGYGDVLIGGWQHSGNAGQASLFLGASAGLSTSTSSTWEGNIEDDDFAVAAGAGDVNGDGYDDVALGVRGLDEDSGAVYVYHGSASGLSTTVDTLLEGEADSAFGVSVAGGGDVNGDGYGDLVVGGYLHDGDTGRAWVFEGSAAGLATTASVSWDGTAKGDYFGWSVAAAGDLDGDGYDDIAVGSYGYDGNKGRLSIFAGSASGAATTATLELTGANTADRFGACAVGGGDLDGDGYEDLAVGAYGYDSNTGRVYLYLGDAGGIPTTADLTLDGAKSGGAFGSSLATAGDVDGDGYDDLLVGAPWESDRVGRLYAFLGSSTGPSTAPDASWDAPDGDGHFGASLAAGDLDGDGYDDIAVGATTAGDATEGAVYLFGGTAGGLASRPQLTLTGAEGDYMGSVNAAGDVDGDGFDDLLVTASGALFGAGAVYLHRGWYAGLDADGDGVFEDEDCDDADATVYPGASEVVDGLDNDCDGLVDLNHTVDADGGSTFTYAEEALGLSVTLPAGSSWGEDPVRFEWDEDAGTRVLVVDDVTLPAGESKLANLALEPSYGEASLVLERIEPTAHGGWESLRYRWEPGTSLVGACVEDSEGAASSATVPFADCPGEPLLWLHRELSRVHLDDPVGGPAAHGFVALSYQSDQALSQRGQAILEAGDADAVHVWPWNDDDPPVVSVLGLTVNQLAHTRITFHEDRDGDGLFDLDERDTHGTDPELWDSDGDGASDSVEILLGSDALAATELSDGDVDQDGLEAPLELRLGTDPELWDSDGDGIDDLRELLEGSDPADASSAVFTDRDGDGVDDHYTDTDADGVRDWEELLDGTSPIRWDTDGDGIDDGREQSEGTDPLDRWDNNFTDADGDGQDDGYLDPDEDGLASWLEDLQGTDPELWDSDGDGIDDGREHEEGTDPLDAADSSWTDSDGDGVEDGYDNCPDVANEHQLDRDGDGVGAACDDDEDSDTGQADSGTGDSEPPGDSDSSGEDSAAKPGSERPSCEGCGTVPAGGRGLLLLLGLLGSLTLRRRRVNHPPDKP